MQVGRRRLLRPLQVHPARQVNQGVLHFLQKLQEGTITANNVQSYGKTRNISLK